MARLDTIVVTWWRPTIMLTPARHDQHHELIPDGRHELGRLTTASFQRSNTIDMTQIFKPHGLIAVLMSLALAACASSTTSIEAPTANVAASSGDDDMSCRQLTGRMQVRLLEYRDRANQSKTTSMSRGLQSAVTSIFGGSKAESDPDGEYKRARQQLEAYNARLAAKNCKTFDIERELQSSATGATPTPSKQ